MQLYGSHTTAAASTTITVVYGPHKRRSGAEGVIQFMIIETDKTAKDTHAVH